ncbi:hypothetical protein BKA70DRAFT_1427919 [Coprinopsis sp. MPI-PUGE-AT-0042]|nr:hypothetical protein BKA70DRAFT_1427919 [Coprinopsis sp. MPI-PUGE-AT-0042]
MIPSLHQHLLDASEEEVIVIAAMIQKGANSARSDDTKTLKSAVGKIYDEEEPWAGLFRNKILVKAYKHIFMSPSSVEREVKAICSGNARIYGMTSMTRTSLAYIGIQVRFSLTSASIFSCSDSETDSETFYNSILDLLKDPEEQEEAKDLLIWWDKQIFPLFSNTKQVLPTNSAFARIKGERAQLQEVAQQEAASASTC